MASLSTVEVFAFSSLLFAMTIGALVMNFLVCLVVYRSKELRRQISSVFVVNLAVCDFMMAVFAMPYSLGAILSGNWPFGKFWCQTTAFGNTMLSLAAVLTLAVISIDRYIAVIKPLQYRAKMTMQWALLMILFVWFQAAIFSIVPLGFLGWYTFNWRYYSCTFPSDLQKIDYLVFSSMTYAANVGLSLVVMLITYYRIFKVAKLHSRRIGHAFITAANFGRSVRGRAETSRQREFKAARKILFVIGAFVCCIAPYTILRFLELCGKTLDLNHSFTLSLRWCAFLKSAIDPCIYGLLQRRFRRALVELFLGSQRARIARMNSLPCGPIRLKVRMKQQDSMDSENGTVTTATNPTQPELSCPVKDSRYATKTCMAFALPHH